LDFQIGFGGAAPGRSVQRGFEEGVERVRVGMEHGFTYAGTGFHWVSHPAIFLQPFAVLGYIAAKCPGIGLSTFLVLPIFSPVDIAEQVATIDHLCGGKFILTPGVGWHDPEYEAAGTEKRYRGSRFEESVLLMKRLWTGEEVTFEGRHFQVHNVRMALPPIQKPHPPVWVAAQSEGAVRRAARVGDAPYIPFQAGYNDVARLIDAYKDELKKVGKPYPKRMPILRTISVDNDRNAARERVKVMEHRFDWYLTRPQGSLQEPTTVKLVRPWEEELRERTIAGTPEEVVEGLMRYVEDFGINYFSLGMLYPSQDQKEILDHIAFVGEKVLAPLRGMESRLA